MTHGREKANLSSRETSELCVVTPRVRAIQYALDYEHYPLHEFLNCIPVVQGSASMAAEQEVDGVCASLHAILLVYSAHILVGQARIQQL